MSAKVLLIDDNANLLKLISIILRQSGFDVQMAHSGKLGVSLAEAEKPDLVLLDVMMPDMNGYEVCRQLRANADLAHTRIILFSAMSRRKDKETGFEAGADDYLIKPIHPVELVSKVREVLSRSREELNEAKKNIMPSHPTISPTTNGLSAFGAAPTA
jgi:DNA-binding response OmpR family regulator